MKIIVILTYPNDVTLMNKLATIYNIDLQNYRKNSKIIA